MKSTRLKADSRSPAPAASSVRTGFKIRWVAWLGCLVLGAQILPAQPPPNDQCDSALVIPAGGPFPYWTPVVDITDGSTASDPPAPSCPLFSSHASRSTWYVFSPALTGDYQISTCSDAPTATTLEDTLMAIYTSVGGCQGPFVEIANGCNDDACGPTGLQSSLLARLFADTTYYVVVWQFDDTPPAPSNRSLQMMVNRFVKPDNDTCALAPAVELFLPVNGTTVGATNHYQLADAACFAGVGQRPVAATGPDVVYTFTAPSDGLYSIKVLNYGTQGDLVLYAASDCPDGPYPATVTACLGAANRNPVSSAESVVCLPLAESQRIYIYVDEEGSSAGSTFILEVAECHQELEPNDSQETANHLNCALTGSIGTPGDVDYFAIGAPPAGSRLFAMTDGEAANLTDFDLRVVTLTDTLEYDNDNNDFSFGDSSPGVAGTILNGEPTFIRVNYNGPVAVEPYRLYALVQPALEQATPETEPNDTLPEANTAPNNYFYGLLSGEKPSSDLDVYQLTAESGEVIFLSLDADPTRDNTPINAKLELLDSFGNVLASVNDYAALSSVATQPGSTAAFVPYSPAESIAHRVVVEGTYFARVGIGTASTGASGGGDYLLSISKNCVAGDLGINQRPNLENLAVAPSATQGQDVSLSGQISDPDLGQTHRVTIDWGDGTPTTMLSFILGETEFTQNHAYPDYPPTTPATNYTIRITAWDNFGKSSSKSVTVTVSNIQPARFLSVRPAANGSVILELEGTPNAAYGIEFSDTMQSWNPLGLVTADNGGRIQFEDQTVPLPRSRFYRAVAP
jgi:hypothetical protein